MHDSAKYLIHANITANGVVERSDVVGAVFGQTEGLLGDELDLRDLQDSSKVGRIDVQITSEGGQSFGHITIGSRLDKVETAILAAALETIDRVGPCRATVEVIELEDVRSAKRKAVVERATQLLADFEDASLDSQDLVEQVRESLRVEDITEFAELPAGPRVADSDAIIVVEGRADVLRLLRYGIKNAVAVEGTDVPEAIAELTQDRTVTTFLDGDRGGDLILKELSQVGDVDYVALAPNGKSVEDLSRGEVLSALREKVPYEVVADAGEPLRSIAATDGSARPAPPEAESNAEASSETATTDPVATRTSDGPTATEPTDPADDVADSGSETGAEVESEPPDSDEQSGETTADETAADGPATTLAGHVQAVIDAESGTVRLLDPSFDVLDDAESSAAFDAVATADTVPATVVLDGELEQRLLDVAAQRGVEQVVARSEGEFVKRPTDVRVRTADDF
ncbi:DNA primase DnaG [Haloarculaceae archaeon H-GB2-1]|nr:DNA primase DnaG [Haloarculaceae archaeon H-GB1-1]MEA5385932.1 DNA primase DnaG [Haloarculaceae archaeon H-GB11]MEA5407439.1 DNA primase DnaG [Haloarculaceae archaeon H-GB2-1]